MQEMTKFELNLGIFILIIFCALSRILSLTLQNLL